MVRIALDKSAEEFRWVLLLLILQTGVRGVFHQEQDG
jgi:hypothetical protein